MDGKGFLGALFDMSFDSFITMRIVKVLYILMILMAAVVALGVAGAGFSQGFMVGLLALFIGAPLVFLVNVIGARVYVELVLVAFRIADHCARTADATTEMAGSAEGAQT